MSIDDLEPKVRQRILNLIRLAEGGIGGEKINAETFLQDLLDKYGLHIDDFREDEKIEYTIRYRTVYEKKLMFAVLRKVCNRDTIEYRQQHGARSFILMELTKVEKAEYDYLWDIYQREMWKHMDAANIAFIQGNRIWAANPIDKDNSECKPPSKREKEIIEKARALIMTTKRIPIHRSIEGKIEPDDDDSESNDL